MKLLYKILKQDPTTRQGVVMTTSAVGIIVNVLLASIKVAIGVLANSIAVISEGINNATDSLSSVITMVGAKLSNKRPTKKHPFGYGRIEYITSLVIAGLIIATAVELLKSSIKLIIEPEDLTVNTLTLIIIAASALVKLWLAWFTIKKGRQVNSGILVAMGTDSRNDCIVSAVTIVSALIFIIFHLSVDAYAGIITSLFIFKAGFDILKDTLANLLGQPVEKETADELYKIIRSTPGVLNAADMILHNYGPDRYSGSVNIEMDHQMTVEQLYATIHKLQLDIMHQKGITMVFGIYAVDRDHSEIKQMRHQIAQYVRGKEHIISYHALYLEPQTNLIYVDLVVDYDLKDWDGLRTDFTEYMHNLYPDNKIELTIETEYV
ncbi:MAG: cation diffusion facilitator family transporter [Bacteroidaceae bacterium]|nr:cation diffusion facilitator family transporter [Bacteroidaceae bacterium]